MVKQLMKPKEGYNMMRRLLKKITYIVCGVLCCVFMWFMFTTESYAFTRTTGEVTGSSVKVRLSASTDAEVVASVKAGDELDVTDAVNGTDGKVWYKIAVSADKVGYIRSDFVKLEGGEQAPSTTTTPGTTQVTPMDDCQGHTNTNNVKVREQASTGSREIDRLNQDIVFDILGTAQDVDGKTWYQVSYIDDGVGINGFIRSDLVTMMEKEEEPLPEGEVIELEDPDEEEPAVPTPEKNYEAVFTTDENGQYVWYLYDRTAGQRYKVDQLLQVDKEDQEKLDSLSGANFGLKIALIISVCLLIMMIVAVVFYILKMKEEEEEKAYKKRVASASRAAARNGQTSVRMGQNTTRTNNGVKPQTLTKPQQGQSGRTPVTSQAKAQTAKPQTGQPVRTSTTQQAAVRPQPEQKQKTSWKAKNFLEDNDEFEFGFLDFDDE